MATTTPNFGWPVPTSTDLVKDGAVAIESLGDAIDASLLDLKGGTTDQVLAKNSNTDMDFKWVSDATGMTNPMTTTGDVIYSSSGSTPARLGIGTAGQVLKVNSGATAPEWGTASASGGWQVVKAETTFTSVASTSTTFDSIFSSSYNYYMVQIKALGGGTAATDDLQLQMLYSGTTQTSGYYGTTFGNAHGGASPASVGTSGAAQFIVSPDASGSATTGDRITGLINFYQCHGVSATAAFQGQLLQGYNYANYVFAGQSSTARTYTGFLLKASSGNISGTLAVYGLA
jgi:hypothetical protein